MLAGCTPWPEEFAQAYRAKGRPLQALEDYNRALAIAPGHADATYNRGVIMLDLERAAEALAEFDAVMDAYQTNYPPSEGIPELRKAVAGWYKRELGIEISPDWVVVASGRAATTARATRRDFGSSPY